MAVPATRYGSTVTTPATRAPSFHGGRGRLRRTSMAGHRLREGFTCLAAQGLTRQAMRSAWGGPDGTSAHLMRRVVTPGEQVAP